MNEQFVKATDSRGCPAGCVQPSVVAECKSLCNASSTLVTFCAHLGEHQALLSALCLRFRRAKQDNSSSGPPQFRIAALWGAGTSVSALWRGLRVVKRGSRPCRDSRSVRRLGQVSAPLSLLEYS